MELLGDAALKRVPALVLPSGALRGANAVQIRIALRDYVAQGGTLLVFAQQLGSDFTVLPTPDGRPIHAYGWFEDNSCYWNAAYIDTFHPILASQPNAIVTSAIDGYFDDIPDNAIVLLRRLKNGLPAMFMYPYGQGWVIVSSNYDDWGGFNQSSFGAQAIIRDAVAWAMKPADLPLNLPGASVQVVAEVKNETAVPAVQVKLSLMSPSRDRVVAEQTVATTVAADGTAQIPFSYAFPADAEVGIYHVDYELLDGAGVGVQPIAEADSGRIVIARPPASPYRPADLTGSVVMPAGEAVLRGDPAVFRYRLANRASAPRTLRLYHEISHGQGIFAGEVVVPATSSVEGDITISTDTVGGGRFWLHVFEVGGVPKPFQAWVNVPGETAAYQLSDGKGFQVLDPGATITVQTDRQIYTQGQTATVTVTLLNRIPAAWSGVVDVVQSRSQPELNGSQPVSLTAFGSATLTFSLPVPPLPPTFGGTFPWYTTFDVSVHRGGTWAGEQWVLVHVAQPQLQTVSLQTPAWSRTAPNRLTWTIENTQPVPLLNGTVRLRLSDELDHTLAEETRPLALGEGPARTTLTFDLPPLPAALTTGTMSLSADNGFGRFIGTSQLLSSRVVASATLSAADFSASSRGEVRLRLANAGTFQEEGLAGGSIDGIGALAPIAYSLAPGQSVLLTFPFQVPASVIGGLHHGVLTTPLGPSTPFDVPIRPAVIAFSVEDRAYTAGEPIVVTVQNTGGSSTTANLNLTFADRITVSQALTLDALTSGTVTVPIPAQMPTGSYTLALAADDRVSLVGAIDYKVIHVIGTAAELIVETDAALYVAQAPLVASAHVTNAGPALDGALLHLEMSTACIAHGGPVGSYHVETWDGHDWVERAVRHRNPSFETDVVDLSAFLPDADGEFKVRVRQALVSPAILDYAALLSGGALVPPTTAVLDASVDVVHEVTISDDQGASVFDRSVVLTFPEAPRPSLVYRAREGGGFGGNQSFCERETFFQKDYPLDLAPGAVRDVAESLQSPSAKGQYFLTGTVRTRDGDVLAERIAPFEVIDDGVSVSVRTDAPRYRSHTPIPVFGTVRNQTNADEPSLTLVVLWRMNDIALLPIHTETLSVPALGSADYAFVFDADTLGFTLTPDVNLVARVNRGPSPFGFIAEADWSFTMGAPVISADLRVPDPPVRLVPSTPALVEAAEADMDNVSKADGGELIAALPFPVFLRGVRYDRFRQSVDGFVELTPAFPEPPPGFVPRCLSDFTFAKMEEQIGTSYGAALLAPYLGDLDPSASGFVGYKLYAAGSSDRAGRRFAQDTLVFFWEAPAKGDGRINRLQVLLSRDGLMRLDTGLVFLTTACDRTGVAVASVETFPAAPAAPFGVRVETLSDPGPVPGAIDLANQGTFPGTVTLDYGAVDGARTVADVTLAPGERKRILFTAGLTQSTTFSLQMTGDAEANLSRNVVVGGGLSVEYAGPTVLAPGSASFPVTLVKNGGVGGPVTVTYRLDGPLGPQTVARTYDVEPGFVTPDSIPFEVPEGALTLAAEGTAVSMTPVALLASPRERVTFTAQPGPVSGGILPVSVDISNTGRARFDGEVAVDGVSPSRTTVSVAPGAARHLDLPVSLTGAATGPQEVAVRLFSAAGVLIGEKTFAADVVGPRVALVQSPAGQAFEPASTARLHFVLENQGDGPATGGFRFSVFDEQRETPFTLGAGETFAIDYDVPIEVNVPAKTYPGRYVLQVAGRADQVGQIDFTVNGIALAVDAALDREVYREGDTARFTVHVSNGRPALGVDYVSRVHYGGFEEVRSFTVAGDTTLVFDVPLPRITGEQLFLGIAHADGTSLYINTFNVRGADALLSLALDRQAYTPGSAVTFTATPATDGTLTVNAPGFSEALTVTGPVTRSFALPADLPGGSYAVAWSFAASDRRSASGSSAFDVAGLRVRVFGADLDRGRYESGDTIVSRLRINTNEQASLLLRGFVVDPEGSSQLAGEVPVDLDPASDLIRIDSWPFRSTIAGLHRFVFGIYRGTDTLLASGSVAFDVGFGAVLGVRTSKADYPSPTEPVRATVSAFVSGPVSLHLEIDGESRPGPDVTSTGIAEIPVELTGVAPGAHELAAVLEGGGYVSRRATAFSLGTSLPDLVPGPPIARRVVGGAWAVDVTVSNVGKSDAAASALALVEVASGRAIATVPVPAVPAGSSVVVSADWNVLGAAGAHELQATADPANVVQEFREDNNTSTGTADVPALVVAAVSAAASYPASTSAALGASVVNLTGDTAYGGLTVAATVTRPDSFVITLAPAAVASLPALGSASVSTPWPVGRSMPGSYVLKTQLLDSIGAILDTSLAGFEVAPTVALTGSARAAPSPAPAHGTVVFSGHVVNQGNVAVSGTAVFELLAGATIAARFTTPIDVPLEGAADVSVSVPSLDVSPGQYGFDLRVSTSSQEHPVAHGSLTVTGAAVTVEVGADPTPRVLVFVGAPEGGDDRDDRVGPRPRKSGEPHGDGGRQRDFVNASLQGSGAIWKVVTSRDQLATEVRSGRWNTFVLMMDEPSLSEPLAGEVREAVFRGDGLVFIQPDGGSVRDLEEALGARVSGSLPGNGHALTILNGPLGPAGTLLVPGRAQRLELQKATKVGTMGGAPVLAVNGFGLGRAVTMAFDPAVTPSDPARAPLQDLFARSVAYAARRLARPAAAGTVLPLAVSLTNPGGSPQELQVRVSLPADVVVASVDDSPTATDPPTWQVILPAGGRQLLRFQVLLPDRVGSYDVSVSTTAAGVSIGPSRTITLEVTRTVAATLADTLAVLQSLSVPPSDRGHLEAAIAHLREAQPHQDGSHELEPIEDATKAAEELGKIRSFDLSAERIDLGYVVAAWEQALHGETGHDTQRFSPSLSWGVLTRE